MEILLALLSVIAVLVSANLSLDPEQFIYASMEEQKRQGWNPEDKDYYIDVMEDGLSFYTTNDYYIYCIRGKAGFSEGRHTWEIFFPIVRRLAYCGLGVGTVDAPLRVPEDTVPFGTLNQSWGWELEGKRLYPHPRNSSESNYYLGPMKRPEKIIVILDMDEGTLSFITNDSYSGVAFTSLRGRKLYPMACTSAPFTAIQIKFMVSNKDSTNNTSTESITGSSGYGYTAEDVTNSPQDFISDVPKSEDGAALYTTQTPVPVTSHLDNTVETTEGTEEHKGLSAKSQDGQKVDSVVPENDGLNTKYTCRCETANGKLQSIVEHRVASSQAANAAEDQYDRFGKHIASQLKELPVRSFVVLQNKIQELITHERLVHIDGL